MVILDTSIWIEFFRFDTRLDLKTIVNLEDIHICPPIYMEVLQGIRDEKAFQKVKTYFKQFKMVESPLSEELIEEAIHIFRLCKRSGLPVRNSVDCIISACAKKHNLSILHIDRDYKYISQIFPIKEKSIK
ncbi:MAG: PIN domain-containing protein [Leptospiraceae bacterium]|nr:PIN domain-containing protein [Leptospiraceae bacterium]MCP5499695.1 PIN domain-containing protein [Leptospiraceae bacterium]